MKQVYLVCNAHIDPVWQWQWDEGVGIALSTFRTAADFCEEHGHFVFNHNESLLYEWVKEYDPALFTRIKALVSAGKWKIMGGWYLQPDGNMPAGESIIRQITAGHRFFEREFGVKPETAVNFDTFGHCRGLVQILAAAGYRTYMFMRPDKGSGMLEELPQYFWWEGFGGTTIPAFRLESQYATATGKVVADTSAYIDAHEEELLLKTWGIGDHGGGPSRKEWQALEAFIAQKQGEITFRHTGPDSYFRDVGEPTYKWDKSIQPMFIGAYTSMSDVKKGYRQLENALYATEKLAAAVSCQGLMPYPHEAFEQAERGMLFAAFHDTLAGTISRTPEKEALQSIGFALEILERVRTRAFYAIASREAPAKPDSLPVFVYNPHPYPVSGIWECEYTLADYNWEDCTYRPLLYRGEQEIDCQSERESGNVPVEYRKRIAFAATLAPMAMERFDLFFEKMPVEKRAAVPLSEPFTFDNDRMQVEIDPQTGLIRRYRVEGRDMAANGFGTLAVYADSVDPWGMLIKRFGEQIGSFRLMTPEETAVFAGVKAQALAPVRIVEDGAVRTVVEVCLRYNRSEACVQYKLPKDAVYIDVELIVYWNERDSLLRLEFPVPFRDCTYSGQTMFGVDTLAGTGEEQVCQKWAAVQSDEDCLSVINDGTYGLSCADGLRLSLLRAPAHAAMPVLDRQILPDDRFTARIDQGEKRFSFRIEGGKTAQRLETVDRESQVLGEKPHVLNVFPTASGKPVYRPPLEVEGGRLDAVLPCGEGWLLRLFNPHDREQRVRVRSELFGVDAELTFAPYGMKTCRIGQGSFTQTDLFGNL